MYKDIAPILSNNPNLGRLSYDRTFSLNNKTYYNPLKRPKLGLLLKIGAMSLYITRFEASLLKIVRSLQLVLFKLYL
jgi:hypothetical protein